jgi:hypothetical protein
MYAQKALVLSAPIIAILIFLPFLARMSGVQSLSTLFEKKKVYS